jgi:cellulose synthase/poly-beta-1,6-N-acetylglucosamine synthase-like glycosyltransferase
MLFYYKFFKGGGTMADKPNISIIVPVRNAERTLNETFEYLFKLNYPREKMEIVLADGGSTDKTVEVIKKWQEKYPFIKLVNVPNCPSPGFARNKALDHVKGDFLFFTDGDCAPTPEWINIILDRFSKDPEIAGAGGEIFTKIVDPNNIYESYCEQTGFLRVAGRYWYLNIQEGNFPALADMSPSEVCGHRAFYFATANAAYRKSIIDKLGLKFWNEPTGEDIEFSLQMRKAGYKLYFVPEARVDHMHRASMEALLKVWVGYGKGHPVLVNAHAKRVFEIVFQNFRKHPRVKFPFPVKGLVYLGNFHWMHIMALGFITSIFFNKLIALGFLLFTLRFIYKYFGGCFNMQPKNMWATWCKLKYLTNWSFMKGALLNFKKYKILYIEPSF